MTTHAHSWLTTPVANKLTLTPYRTTSRAYWYGESMTDTTLEDGAGAAFKLEGLSQHLIIEWRRLPGRGFHAFMTANDDSGNSHRYELGSPKTLQGLARAVSAYWNKGTTRYTVSAPTSIDMPGEF